MPRTEPGPSNGQEGRLGGPLFLWMGTAGDDRSDGNRLMSRLGRTPMDRRVVRVEFTHTYEYDVVFDDGVPSYVGAVIKRPASVSGPRAGKIIDTHRTNWDGRDCPEAGKRLLAEPAWGSPGHTATIVQRAAAYLSEQDSAADPAVPAMATRPKRIRRRR